MAFLDCTTLKYVLSEYSDDARLCGLAHRLSKVLGAIEDERQQDALVELYRDAVQVVEEIAWKNGMLEADLATYQALFRELEQHLVKQSASLRHDFVIVIPVADRPLHLQQCINSIFELCRLYNYGGMEGGYFSKVCVLVADDSSQAENIERHRALCHEFVERGLRVSYYSEQDQRAQLDRLSEEDRHRLSSITGSADRPVFHHKGASITRNISCLKLLEMVEQKQRPLFYFIDSDQEFRVRLCDSKDNSDVYAINYFYHLDRLFSFSDIRVLTGKVVGDPPVSPAVMASNLLDDIIAFLSELDTHVIDHACCFHGDEHEGDNAYYHDMSELFGFSPAAAPFRYQCPIKEAHDHGDCFDYFAHNIKRFFDGEHPTRKTCYSYEPVNDSIKPARTLYTGNYVINTRGLSYFIPFANLSLRMAGPTLGRLIKSEIGPAFVSAALPMLHKRTVQSAGRSEYRAGIRHGQANVDLSAEFERQFYGDVMLFTIEKLGEHEKPEDYTADHVRQVLLETEKSLRKKYTDRHRDILIKTARVRSLLNRDNSWWTASSRMKAAMQAFNRFLADMEHNYGEQAPAYELINSDEHRRQRLAELQQAILGYADDRRNWDRVVNKTIPLNRQAADLT